MTSVDVSEARAPRRLVLKSVRILNFRCLQNVEDVALQSGLTVVAGQNAGGKTTFLNALSFLLNGPQSPDDSDRSHECPPEEDIIVEGAFSREQGDGDAEVVRYRARKSVGGTRRLEISERMYSKLSKSLEAMTVQELKDMASGLTVVAPLRELKANWIDSLESFIAEQPEDHFEDRWRTASTLESNALPTIQLFDGASAKGPVQLIHEIVRARFQLLITEERHVQSLSTLQDNLNTELQSELETLQSRVIEHCPELESIFIESRFEFARQLPVVDVQFGTIDQRVSIDRGGLGRNRRVALAIYEANLEEMANHPDRSLIVAYDEPDTHLDHLAQKRLSRILNQQAAMANVQIVVATHSKNFVDVVPLSSVLCFQSLQNEFAKVSTLGLPEYASELRFQSEVYESLGFRNSTLIDEKCFLIVEGPTEMSALPLLYQRVVGSSLITDGIQLISLGGSGAMEQFIKVLGLEWNKQLILMLDTDMKDLKNNLIQDLGLVEHQTVFYVGSREFEDVFDDSTWLALLNTEFPSLIDDDPWTISEIADWRASSKFSIDLTHAVNRKCKDHAIGKPQIGLAIGKWHATNEVAAPAEIANVMRGAQLIAKSTWSQNT